MASTDGPPMTAAFLLCLCIQHSAVSLRTSGLLLRIASGVQNAVWVSSGQETGSGPASQTRKKQTTQNKQQVFSASYFLLAASS